ncbi:MAG: hypothetical protein Q9202_006622 [Teloschistes flavicans]
MMDVIIVGAGIAGLSAGVGLRKAGHKVTILEQSSLLYETGAAITITPNAFRVLRSWDFDVEWSKMVAIRTGSLLNGATMDVIMPNYLGKIEETYGTPLYSVHRVDLHNQLKMLATRMEGPGCAVKILVRAKTVDYDPLQGKVLLADGRILHADLVVAADGVHSTAVAHVLGNKETQASNTGWACMRWLVPTEELRADPEISTLIQDSHQRKARDVRFWKLVAREPIPTWHKDRLVIIGDAAHPMLTFQAQGGGQAIEDGAALGVLLDRLQKGDEETLEARLRLFERIRRNRASAVQVLSNSSPPAPESVRDAAASYLPDGKKFENMDDINEYLWTFDVLHECKAALALSNH